MRLCWLVAGAASLTGAGERAVVHTLDGNPALKTKNLRMFYQETTWRTLKDHPYDAYVIMRGRVREDRTIDVRVVEESYPNELRVEMAKAMSEGIRVSANSVGGRIRSGARIYVVFYETFRLPCEAIVFAEPTGMAAPGASIGGDFFLTTVTYPPEWVPSAMPDPDTGENETETPSAPGETEERSRGPRRR